MSVATRPKGKQTVQAPTTAEIVTADRILDLAHGFTQAVMDDPMLLDGVPDGVTLILLPEGDPETIEINLEIAVESARAGETVLIRHTTRDGRPK